MIFGTWEFAITFEVTERQENSHFVFGFFNIVIDDELLIHRGSNWTLDCIIYAFKKTISDIETRGLEETNLDKDALYIKALETRNYHTYNTPEFLNQRWELSDDLALLAKVDAYSEECKRKVTNPPFGIEIQSYDELTDYGWRFFLFGAGEEERLIYSKDAGKTVFEKRLSRGTVEKVLRSLPDPSKL